VAARERLLRAPKCCLRRTRGLGRVPIGRGKG